MRDLPHPAVEDVDITNVLHALSDPVRLAIVTTLSGAGEMHCAEIAAAIGMDLGKSTLSHHYGTLREAGLTTARYEGTKKYLTLREQEMEQRFPGLLPSILQTVRP